MILIISEHLRQFDIHFLLQFGLNEGVLEVNLTSSPSSLHGQVHYHADSGPRRYGSITLKVIDASNLLVSAKAESGFVLAHSSVRVAFDLKRPCGGEKVCSMRHGLLSYNFPGAMGLEFRDFFAHRGKEFVTVLTTHRFMESRGVGVVSDGGLHGVRSHH
jgi:hypothetical protein